MAAVIAIDIFAIALTVVGFHVAFRQRFVRGLVRQRARDSRSDEAPDPLAPALRIAGVMLMAFGITICAFANLIAYFSSASASAGL